VTTIGFEIPTAGRAGLRIYTVQGILVRTLVNGLLEPGRHTVQWDGRDDRGRTLGSGVYVSELVSDGRRLSRKLSLLK
jgi:flagellar hook assembly protein FlgD